MLGTRRFVFLLSGIFTVIALLVVYQRVRAAALTVPGEYPTIQAAIDAANPGDVIVVQSGTYYENLILNKPVTLTADSYNPDDPTQNNTIIDGSGSGLLPTIDIPSGISPMPAIRGFVIQNGYDGIKTKSEIIVEFNYFIAGGDQLDYSSGSGGINHHNVYSNAVDDAIDLDNMNRPLVIENNRMMYSGDDGIEIRLQDASAPAEPTTFTIRNNVIIGCNEDGIQLIDYTETLDTNRYYVISGNLIANCRFAGIGLMPDQLSNEDYSGANIIEAIRVYNNTLYGNDYGISGGDNLVAFNNIIANSITKGVWRVQGPAGANSVVAYTLFYNNGTDFDQSDLGSGNLFGQDPLFAYPPGTGPDGIWGTVDDDFSGLVPLSGSPVIDVGVAQYYANDEEAIPPTPITVFSGSAPDLGWREFDPFLPPTPTATITSTATPTPPGLGTVISQVNSSSDDAEEAIPNGSVSLSSSDLELGADGATSQWVGMRFNDIYVPPGASILSAYVEFEVDEFRSDPTSLLFQGQASDNAPTFSNSTNDISSRPRTTASVPWNDIPPWTVLDAKWQTPDLSPIVQEIVSRAGWTSGNSLVLLVSGTGRRNAESYDGEPPAAPKLVITYITGSTPTPFPSPTETYTFTFTPTSTKTSPSTSTATITSSPSPAITSTHTDLPTLTPTITTLPTDPSTNTSTITPSPTPTFTATSTPIPSPTPTHSPTATVTPPQTPSQTPTLTNTPLQPTTTNTPTSTPINTSLPTPTLTFTLTNTPSSTEPATITPLPTVSLTFTPTDTPLPTATFTPTNTPLPTSTLTFTPTHTPLPTATFTPTNTAATATTEPGIPQTFLTHADSYVRDSVPTKNFGDRTPLWVDAGPNTETFMRFNVSAMSGSVQSAVLRLYAESGTVDGPAVYAVDNGWTESGITWNTRPAIISGLLDDVGAISSGNWIEYDVTAFVMGEGIYSFVLSAISTDGVSFSSREGSQPPELVVTGSTGSTPTSTPTLGPSPTFTSTLVSPTATSTPTNTPPPTATVTITLTNTPLGTNTQLPTATSTGTPTITPQPPAPTNTLPPAGGDVIYISSTSGGTAGGVVFGDEDILKYESATGTWSLYFDGSDVGLGASSGTDVSAFRLMSDGSILFSFISPSTISGIGSVDDSDIVRFIPTSLGEITAGNFEWYFDGSDVGLTTSGEDIDAVGFAADGRLLISTRGSFSVAGTSGNDEDLIAFTSSSLGSNTAGTWSLYFDGSDVGLGSSSEDVIGASVDPSTGEIFLTTLGSFSVPGVSGTGGDIFICTPGSLGSTTSCTFTMYWVAADNGFGGEVADGIGLER